MKLPLQLKKPMSLAIFVHEIYNVNFYLCIIYFKFWWILKFKIAYFTWSYKYGIILETAEDMKQIKIANIIYIKWAFQ